MPESQQEETTQEAEKHPFPLPTIEELLEAGVHWGHQRKKWNPKMEPFVFGMHNRIHIIDLRKTIEMLKEAQKFAYDIARMGQQILFVGTKRQAKDIIKKYAEMVGMPYVTERWLGGMLTNFITIRRSIRKLEYIDEMIRDGTIETMTKKERLILMRQKKKLERLLGGVIRMTRLPAALYVVDVVEEATAVKEANRLGIPVVAIVDTNADPELVDYPIPGNDDSARSIEIITKYFTEAIKKGREERQLAREMRMQEERAGTQKRIRKEFKTGRRGTRRRTLRRKPR
ncbi:MAG: 30S ribosomal protein S2 [Chlorobi bacterium]|nr:30S ribosomal protein S2 [Chlorobiota bacterium]